MFLSSVLGLCYASGFQVLMCGIGMAFETRHLSNPSVRATATSRNMSECSASGPALNLISHSAPYGLELVQNLNIYLLYCGHLIRGMRTHTQTHLHVVHSSCVESLACSQISWGSFHPALCLFSSLELALIPST